jgi:YidC/Oxa1 family membrane protein insertase
MDKNTIWAIALSTLVIIGAFVIQPMLFPQNKQIVPENQTAQIEETAGTETPDSSMYDVNVISAADSDEQVEEKTFTVKTDKVEVVFTNKGGDILSYKLLDHNDIDTKDFVQLSDNITDYNRTCSLAIGSADAAILNETFNTEVIDENTILFKRSLTYDGRKITLGKKYTFKPGEYLYRLDILVHCDDNYGLNRNGIAYTLRTSPQIGPKYDPKKNRYENRQFVTYNGTKYKRVILGTNQFKAYDKDINWVGIAGKYFVELVIPNDTTTIADSWYSSKVETGNYANAQAFVERAAFSGSDMQDTYYMYFGPRNDKDLKRYNVAENNAWKFGGHKISDCVQSSGWLNWLETILKFVMELLYKVIPNWGVTIIVLTIILKILLFPLSKNQSMGTLKMQAIQPRMQAIQEKYKNDQTRMQMEVQKLYKEAGYNPVSGCLPMLFQFLILFAMYNLFNNYFEFRGAMFIPNWIPDLSVGDSVKTLNFNIPALGNQIRILPVIYVISQLLFGKITQSFQPMGANQSQASMKMMMYGMPLFFFFIFYNAPAGLILYWTVSNVFSLFQQIIINKMMAEKRAEIAASVNKKIAKGKK